MAEFGTQITTLRDPQAAGSQPIGGVTTPQVRTDIFKGLENKGGMVAGLAVGAASLFGDKQNPILADMTKGLADLTAARESGSISKSEADSRARLIASEAYRRTGGDVDLQKAVKANIETFTGITGMATSESPEEKFQKELDQSTIKGLKDLGFPVVANPTPELMKSYNDAYATMKSSSADVEAKTKALALAHSQFNYDQDTLKKTTENTVNDFISKNIPQIMDTLRTTATFYRQQIKDGKMTPEDAMSQLRAQVEVSRGQLQTLAPGSPQYTASTMQYLDSYEKTLSTILDPKTEEATLQSKLNVDRMKDQLLVRTNGNIRALQALGPLVTNNPLMFAQTNDAIMKSFVELSNSFKPGTPLGVVPSAMSPEDRASLYSTGKDAIKAAMSTLKDQQSGEVVKGRETVDNIVNNLMVASSNVGPNDKIATSKDFVNFLASPEFKIWRSQGKVNSEAIAAAQKMFDIQYLRNIQQPIINKLNQEIPGSVSGPVGGAPAEKLLYKDALSVKFENGQIVFGTKSSPNMDTRQLMVGRAFSADVQQLGQVVNTLIRAGANLKGVSVEQYWNENKSNILPSYFPPNMPDLKVGDVVDGNEYLGGAVTSKNSWKKVQNAGSTN